MHENIHDLANGRWLAILPQAGIDLKYLTGKHTACPACGGKDRFRFSDLKGEGRFFCSGCGHGTGVDLVMRVNGIDFVSAVKLIEPLIPSAPVVIPKATARSGPDGKALWSRGVPIMPHDAAAKYLENRGLKLRFYPSQLRSIERARYVHDDGQVEHYPAMLGNFASPCRSWTTVHITYLTHDGDKAPVPKVRKFYPGRIPEGGAIRLAPSAETMGIAEGIETALSAMALYRIPVWATVSTIAMIKWQPPANARHIIVFADNDKNFAGQYAANGIANQLSVNKKYALESVEVRMPQEPGTDWNDVLQSGVAQ